MGHSLELLLINSLITFDLCVKQHSARKTHLPLSNSINHNNVWQRFWYTGQPNEVKNAKAIWIRKQSIKMTLVVNIEHQAIEGNINWMKIRSHLLCFLPLFYACSSFIPHNLSGLCRISCKRTSTIYHMHKHPNTSRQRHVFLPLVFFFVVVVVIVCQWIVIWGIIFRDSNNASG